MVSRQWAKAHSTQLSLRLLCGVSVGALAMLGSPARAQDQDRNWDANSTAVGNGGTGTWNLSGPTWSPSADGVSGPYSTPWDNSLLDNAVFGGTAGTVTLGDPITVHNITFNVHNYVLSGGTLTLAGATPTVGGAGSSTINSVIAGTAGLTKVGNGQLFLTGVNTFSGGINLNAGTLRVTNDSALGAASNSIVTNGVVNFRIDSGTSNRTVVVSAGSTVGLTGAGTGTAFYTGSGGVNVNSGVNMSNDANDYTGPTRLIGGSQSSGILYFSSVRNLGQASSLGAPTTVADGTISFTGGSQYSDRIAYTGSGDSTDRNWVLSGGTLRRFQNVGSGTLTITGDIEAATASGFEAAGAGFDLQGVISGAAPSIGFTASASGTITLGGANTYTGLTGISGGVVRASVLADTGLASSLGTNANVNLGANGTLTYIGTGDTSNRIWSVNGAAGIGNEGTGALALTGDMSFNPANPGGDSMTFGGTFAGLNSFGGVISGVGNLISTGSSIWELNGANTRVGTVTVEGGTLRAGNADAFGTITGITVNGGILDAGTFDLATPTLAGSGGTILLGGGTLTANATTAQSFGGSIAGIGGLTKLGAGTLTLTGASTYTGPTTVGGGKLALDFSPAGGPAANIIGASSPLILNGGIIEVIGAAGEVNAQSFGGLNITAGSNTVRAISGIGGSLNLSLGLVNRTGGLANFVIPETGAITTSNPDGALGGWATINGSDYAKVLGGGIIAFDASDYTDKDDASTWLTGEIISDAAGAADSPFFGNVSGNVQLGGLRYTAANASTVTVGAGSTLGVDGTIIVAPSVLATNQTITGGSLTGGLGGGALGVQQNGTGTFTIGSTIVDNIGATGLVKGGGGTLLLSGLNSYTGATTITNGALSVSNIGNGGVASGIGASTAASSNLILEGGTLQYTGATATTDRGLTLVNGGVTRTIQVTDAGANLTFTGHVTSPDDAGLNKSGAGTLTLANAGNDYVGVTTVSGGTLAIDTLTDGGVASNIGAATNDSANIVLAGGTLSYTGATTSSDRGMTFGAGGGGVGVADAASTLTLSGILTGTALRKEGAGTLLLSGANTFTNGTTINEGVVQAGAVNVFGGGAMTIAAGAQLDLDGFDNLVSTFNGAGNVDLGSGRLTVNTGGTFSGTISGSGGLTRSGSSQFSLNISGCNNTYTGSTVIIGGSLSVDCLADGGLASGIGASSASSSNLLIQNSGILTYTGSSVSIDRGIGLAAGFGYVSVVAGTTLEFEGQVTGSGVLRKRGDGTLLLSGSNDYSGGNVIEQGVLRAGSNDALGTGNLTISNVVGAAFDLNNFNSTIRAIAGGGTAGGNILLGTATMTLNATGSGATDYAGAISGSGGLVKNGTFTQRLTGCDSSYTGTTSVNSGLLSVSCLADGGANSSIGASTSDASSLVLNGGTLQYTGVAGSTNRQFTLGPSATSKLDASGSGAIDFTNTAALSFSSPNTAQTLRLGGTNIGNNSLAAQITNNGAGVTSLTKLDAGTWILKNSNSDYTGVTTISGGVLGVDKLSDGGVASSIGASSAAASNLVIGNGSTLRYTGSGDTTNRLFTLSSGVTFIESSGTGAIVFTDTGPVTLQSNNQARTIALGGTNGGNNTLAGSIGNAGTGITTLAKNDSGTWVLTGNHTYTGSTNINAGLLSIGGGGTTGSISSAIVNNFGTLQFNRSDQLIYGGAISGTGAVNQAGTGTTVLTGTNVYSGGTTISAGTLRLGNGGATGSIIGNVTNNGTLAFNRNNGYQFNGAISGNGAVAQIGTGTTTLTAVNSYTGGTAISAGTLRISSDANLGAASGGVTINGGMLNTSATMTSNRAVNMTGNGTILTDPATTLTLGGVVSGTGRLTKSGTGTLVVTANNSYTGGTTISAGTLQIGNGAATGSILGDVLNNGTLVFNRSGTLAMTGLVSGGGTVVQSGAGTTVLSGNNSYAGATSVTAGTLLVNGDQSGSTGLTSVASGATLGGAGTIGGNVILANGGILSAGSDGVGTLTINGDLALADTSRLNFEFGQANVPGGPLNDLVNVGGNLTLDGTVNVTQTTGGNFAPGVYRMFNYSGALTDNGATVGVLPGGSVGFIQTAISNQVNLVNTAGLALNFWDGSAGPKNDSLIQGGDGIWRLANGANDWTEVNGAVNADYGQDSFAIFQGTGGIVTVDNGGGNVLTSGMQFTSDGYIINGDALTLTGAEALVRVGDGSPTDTSIVTRIDAVLTGTASLTKDLGGTLVLTGANSYTGGTAINGGTLAISADSNMGDLAGALSLDGGTLNTMASFTSNRAINLAGVGTFMTDGGTTFSAGGAISGGGALTKDGQGSLILTNANSYAGGTTVNDGTLSIGDGGTSGSILGNIANDGAVAFNRSDDVTFAGLVTGSGSLQKLGGGILTLTNDNSYTGGTTIGAGALQLGDGGANGGIAGDVLNNGALLFNRSDVVNFLGVISGSGRIAQTGPGTTILMADNSYTGTTDVNAGTLLVNGDQSLATGLTTVNVGGTLGGLGTIGGDVAIADGATLAPGDATGPGTLTINGNLAFSGGSSLAYDFGQSDIVGGPLNDHTQVGGDLTLDGTIDVTVTPGGSFGPGLYRVISYGGTLTDNGLAVGTLPPGSLVAVQTSIGGQVNLVNATGATLNFWDGGAGPKNDGTLNGGDGIWQNSTGNDNWTEITGGVNGAFADDSFAIFAAASGTVSIDNSLGAVSASGMQFASDGYRITGEDLTLIGPQSTVRVGDGTALGGGFTATVDAVLAGTTQLVKADLGTLVLAGTNSYTGGTRIDAGTLRISADTNLGDAAGELTFSGGTLHATASIVSGRSVNLADTGRVLTDGGTTLALNGSISGAGGLTKTGTGSLILSGTNSFAGDMTVSAGSVFVNGDQSGATGLTSVVSGGSLGGSGVIGGNLTIADGATLAAGTNAVGTLTVNGNLALSAGSLLNFEFGQANVAGGALNDLVNVGGDLVLDGTINVSVPSGGTFGPGIYRAINYGGALTDNGLTLGTLPGGSAVSVQTAIAGQVNLVNTAGLTLSFWDGAAGPKNDGAVNGGDGVWRVAGSSNNWTDLNGSVNADYAQDSFAIFSAAPGTVTVDNVGGAVLASGMQFASDGYRITGDALTLTGAQAIIQVGDGSAASAGYNATIDAEITGTAGLVKTDTGMLVLAGTNSYSGGTTINGGTVRISSDANLGDTAGGLTLDGGTLNSAADIDSNRSINLAGAGTLLTDDATTLTLGGVMSGAGTLTKDGLGSLVLTGANNYGGGTNIAAGSLQIGNGGATGSIIGDVANDGVLAFNRSDNLTFAGAITGGGAVDQIGGGATILTGANSYSGGTTISGGILQIGAGGASGSIAGNVLNNAALVFNRSDTVSFAGLISGSGRVEQAGGGTTILTGPNSYSGATTVSGGTLLINGDQSAATGATNVASGATLGGTGIIGGDVTVADGASLAPGQGGAGTLGINGNLSLAAGAALNVDFGAANAVGSPLNDVVNVGGDLVLDGTINVAVTPGGAFDIGLYRVINYGGALTDNGLAIGAMPAGADAFVQTSVAGQVNLINVGGATLNFWDGAAGPKFNGAVNGGDGVWQNSGGNDNWADATGAVNAGYADGAFAIFTGAAGAVTIDNGLGAVTASGLQFAVDGYSIGGDTLTLTGPQSVIRVGDGTAAGAGYTALIASTIAGTTQLVKTDAGTLVLTGSNSYTGGTAINGGSVRISSDANLGAVAGGLNFNGGTLNSSANMTSARAVDLAGAGTFLTDTGTTLTLNGAVSGAGSLTKTGTGTLVLAGVGGHAGGTSVAGGTLFVNGDYSAATGATSVASGAVLGGTGTIGGNVSFADGATLAPGAGGAGTLSIGGNLSLAAGTTLAYEFGAANAVGGGLNDLVNVGGNLTLDGTINVTVPTSGAFDVGVYRVFNYGGSLTNNGLALGALPAGSSVAVQTSVAGQVNLVNSAGLTLSFWDGAAGPKNNGVINGGNGIWQNSAGNDNWTEASGAVNAAYSDSAFAVFGGTGGTVTVDNGLGQVTAAGMQFAANGYTVTGDAIALDGPQSTIRVGDGTTAGAAFAATINANIAGDTQLVKTDAGTLVLGGTNSYTGGTLVTGGTIQIASDANLGAVAGNVTLDGGTLATSADMTSARDFVMAGAGTISTAADTRFTFDGLFSGNGALTKAGAGTLLVTGDNSGYTGATTVTAGTLAINGVLGGAVAIDSGSRLEGTGRVGSLANSGTVAPGGDGFGTLTVNNGYTGYGGTLEIEAVLGGDASQTDRLVVSGGTSGTTQVDVVNRGGLGAQTVEGVKIVDVMGGNSAGVFLLNGDYIFGGEQAVIAGAFGYRLYQGGVATPTDGDWYLRSALLNGSNEPQGPLYQPGVPLYENYGQTLQALNSLPTLQERVGNRSWARSDSGASNGLWGRMESTRARPDARVSAADTDANIDSWKLQIGTDRVISENDYGTVVAGVTGHYGESNASVRSIFGGGTVKAKGYGAGATLTWYHQDGFYADAQAQITWFDGQLKSSVLGTLADGNEGTGKAFSLELGKRAVVGNGLTVTPQIQMSYQDAGFDSFTDPSGARVSSSKGDSLKSRWGISLDHQTAWESNGTTRRSHLYGLVNLSYEWLDGTEASVSGTPIQNATERLWGEMALGGSLGLNDRVTVYAQGSASTSIRDFGSEYSVKGIAGVRVAF